MTGRYEVTPDGASSTEAPSDLVLYVSALGALYLGGISWRTLALAGRVTEHRPGALADADALFAASPAPYAGTGF
jgi:hypothetical protein